MRRIVSASQARIRPTGLRWALRQQIPFGGAYLRGLLRSRNDRLRYSPWRRMPTGHYVSIFRGINEAAEQLGRAAGTALNNAVLARLGA